MNDRRFTKRYPFLVIVLVNAILIASVLFLMNYVQKQLYSDVKINLTEVVTQNKDVITSKLQLEVNNLDLIAAQLAEKLKHQGDTDIDSLKNVLLDYTADNKSNVLTTQVYVADKDGRAIFADNTKQSVAGRQYFKLAIKGTPNISERLVSRLTGDDIFVISAPIFYKDEIIGTVQKPYSPQEMYDICSISLFSSQGSMYIINSEGYIMISSSHQDYNQETESYFRTLYSQGNKAQERKLEADILEDKEGFMETTSMGKKMFSAYTPITSIHDWYLISSVATDAVSPNANLVIKMFYLILMVTVFVFAASMFYFLSYKKKEKNNLEQIAFVDTITGGNTYNKFIVDFETALKSNTDKEYYLLAFDIENFKYINGYYGFDFGDKVLRRIHQDVGSRLVSGETVARSASDHFIALLTNAEEKRMDDLLNLVFVEQDVTIYISAGLYKIADKEESLNLMVDKASTAAQSAKGDIHKKIVTYSEQFDRLMIQNEQMKRNMKIALEHHEVVPFYQPKVDINSGKLVGAEALARWITSEGKLIPPIDFIPLCEKTGLILELDMVIFQRVLQFLRKNLDEGNVCVPISVNFSRLHLMNENFIHQITDKIEEYKVPPKLIEIELTESVFFENEAAIIAFVNHLHEHGLMICIDDFGSGYSSLNMLKDIAIDVLKIDKGFIDDTEENQRKRTILSAIAQMAHGLNASVVVEGVETKENVILMKEFGCDIAQGFFFAKPMEEDSFAEVFKKGRVR